MSILGILNSNDNKCDDYFTKNAVNIKSFEVLNLDISIQFFLVFYFLAKVIE